MSGCIKAKQRRHGGRRGEVMAKVNEGISSQEAERSAGGREEGARGESKGENWMKNGFSSGVE